MKKVAVILAGCGAKDGSEIHEATLLLYALSCKKIPYSIFAPNNNQAEVIDHLSGESVSETRNILSESARIARGAIHPLSELDSSFFDALIFAGGTGCAKNLFTYAYVGINFAVRKDVEELIKEFHSACKPIGAMCIAPLMLAKVLGRYGATITTGNRDSLALQVEETYGAIVKECQVADAIVDPVNKLVTTPAYMHPCSTIAEIGQGAIALVEHITTMMNK